MNTVIEFYYAMHTGNEEKIQFMTLQELPATTVSRWAENVRLCRERKFEFVELNNSPDNPDTTVAVIIRFWFLFDNSSTYVDDLITLKKVGDLWKIKLFTEPNLP